MIDRSPKYPGRVKLIPVSGQENTYDMTRADEPDDTGTPFNKRTMIQDSTGRFLRLPVSNPFVDDALRHMPDRIEPIGTVKTSPALSLGDAWLPCDGSQVTFAEYPALCQLLRGVSSAVWDGFSLGFSGNLSQPVFFDGRWLIANLSYTGASGTNYYTYNITIYSSTTLNGTWTAEYTTTRNIYQSAASIHIACSEDKCVVVFPNGAYGSMKIEELYCLAGSSTWTSAYISASGNPDRFDIYGFEESNGTFALVADNTDWNYRFNVYHTETPELTSSWSISSFSKENGQDDTTTFTHVNGNWVLCAVAAYNGTETGAGPMPFDVFVSSDASGFSFTKHSVSISQLSPGAQAVSKLAYLNGRYYLLINGWASSGNGNGTNKVLLASTTDLANWNFQVIGTTTTQNGGTAAIAANEKILVFATESHTWTAADPTANINEATLPSGSVPQYFWFIGDTAYAITSSAIAYHDYSTEARLLPTISLSDDTTTYIKAKNELDVFEAQESGGD